MSSEAQTQMSTAHQWQPIAGSLQAMNLGALRLGQFGQAVNWNNSSGFASPELRPWVDVPTGNAETAKVDPTPPVESKVESEPEVASVVPDVVLKEPDTQPIAAEVPATHESNDHAQKLQEELAKQELEKAAAEKATVDEAAAEKEAALKAAAEKAAADKAELEKAATEKAAREKAEEKALADRIAADKAEADKVAAAKADADRAAIEKAVIDKAAIERAAAENSRRAELEANEQAAARLAASQTASKTARPTVSQAEERTVVVDVTDRPPSKAAIKPVSVSKPIASPVLAPVPQVRTSTANTVERPARIEGSSEDYLLQLERLVLELNMELARRNDEQKPIDPMEQMANRIIALNLENMALREQLQRSI